MEIKFIIAPNVGLNTFRHKLVLSSCYVVALLNLYMYSIDAFLIIGHQSVQAEETCSNVSSPVAADTLSRNHLDQSRCSIHFVLYSN